MVDTREKSGPYAKARSLIESVGGTMKWSPGGGPGAWVCPLSGQCRASTGRPTRSALTRHRRAVVAVS